MFVLGKQVAVHQCGRVSRQPPRAGFDLVALSDARPSERWSAASGVAVAGAHRERATRPLIAAREQLTGPREGHAAEGAARARVSAVVLPGAEVRRSWVSGHGSGLNSGPIRYSIRYWRCRPSIRAGAYTPARDGIRGRGHLSGRALQGARGPRPHGDDRAREGRWRSDRYRTVCTTLLQASQNGRQSI